VQALEVLKIIVGFGTTLVGRVQLFDARHNQWRELLLPKDKQCAVCGE
jgi:molybdopterin/thiamine biosynthesis adenylyltransferase